MTSFPFKVSNPNLKNADGEIDNDGLVDVQSGLGVFLGTQQTDYFEHSALWPVNGQDVRGSWYRLYSGPWDSHNHGSIHRNEPTGRWLRRNVIDTAGPNVGAAARSTWQGTTAPFHPNRPTVLVLLHGATDEPATSPGDHIGELQHARTYWGFPFVAALLGDTNQELFTLHGNTALTPDNWETTNVSNGNAQHHIITAQPVRNGQVPQLSVMLTHRDGSQKLAEQGRAAIGQIQQLVKEAFGSQPGANKSPQIVLIGHSMGGLVARFIASNPADAISGVALTARDRRAVDAIRQQILYIITLATPHEGSPQADKWTAVYDVLHNNVPDWFNQVYVDIGVDGFPFTISYMGGNKDSTRDLRQTFWAQQNQAQLAPQRARRPNGQLIPIYALSGRTPGGQFFDNPNESNGGITPPLLSRDEKEALGLVLFDKTLHALPGGPDGWGTPPPGSHDLDWVRRTTLKELAGLPVAAMVTLLELADLKLTATLIEKYAEYMPYYLDKQWALLSPLEMATALFDSGAEVVAFVLKTCYSLADAAAAGLLQAVGFAEKAIAEAMQTVYGLSAAAMAQLLTTLGYGVDAIAGVMKDVYNQSAAATAAILNGLGYSASVIARVMADVFNQGAAATAEILKGLGYSAGTIARVMADVYNQGAAATAAILKGLGYSASAIGRVMADVYNQGAAATAAILKDLGYSAGAIASVMADVFNQGAAATAEILKGLGYGIGTLAQVMKDVFNLSMQAVADVLHDVGFSVPDIINALMAAFNASLATVSGIVAAVIP